MSHWTRKTRAVETNEIQFCRLCGAEIVQLHFANGHPYWTSVLHERGARIVVLGAGNNFNFKPEHNCLKDAENDLRSAEGRYGDFYSKHAAAKTVLEQMDAADAELIAEKEAIGDHQIVEVLKRLRTSAETNLKTLEDQKPGIDDQMVYLRTKVELLREGKTTVPSDKPAVGRIAKVVKGRKVPVGTQGTIFWMGLDKFKEGSLRIGIETNGQKHYTSVENIEIVKV